MRYISALSNSAPQDRKETFSSHFTTIAMSVPIAGLVMLLILGVAASPASASSSQAPSPATTHPVPVCPPSTTFAVSSKWNENLGNPAHGDWGMLENTTARTQTLTMTIGTIRKWAGAFRRRRLRMLALSSLLWVSLCQRGCPGPTATTNHSARPWRRQPTSGEKSA